MSRLKAAAAGLVFAISIGPQKATSQLASPQVSLTLSKTHFLSSESVDASLVVYNTTTARLAYNPLSVSFVIRDDDGTSHERRWITSITRLITSTWIEPGRRQTFTIPLPVCDVHSDPCSEHVALKFALATADKSQIMFVTPERSYTFEADPTATFRTKGLRGNRPLFIAQAQAKGFVLQRILKIAFQFSAAAANYPTMPQEGITVGRIFEQRGVHAGGSSFTSNADGFQIVVFLRNQDVTSSVEAAIADVRQNFGTKVKLVSTLFTPDDFDIFPLFANADDGARTDAQRMSDFIGGGVVAWADDRDFDGAQQIKFMRSGESVQNDFVPISTVRFPGPSQESAASAVKGLLDVGVRTTRAFVGDRIATGPAAWPSKIGEIEYRGAGSMSLVGLPSRATIAADRPELYAIAQTTTQKADRLGVQARAVAAALAAGRVRALAAELGVVAGPSTLVAAYPDLAWSADETIVATGVASAPAGDLDNSWRKLLATPEPKRGGVTTSFPVAFPIPTSSPVPSPVTVKAAAYLIPISVPDDDTQLAIVADVPNVSSGEHIASARRDCDALVLRTQMRSLSEALHLAVARARTSGTTLRHLVLAAAYPSNVNRNDGCNDRSGADPLIVHAPVELIFRIRQPRTAVP